MVSVQCLVQEFSQTWDPMSIFRCHNCRVVIIDTVVIDGNSTDIFRTRVILRTIKRIIVPVYHLVLLLVVSHHFFA